MCACTMTLCRSIPVSCEARKQPQNSRQFRRIILMKKLPATRYLRMTVWHGSSPILHGIATDPLFGNHKVKMNLLYTSHNPLMPIFTYTKYCCRPAVRNHLSADSCLSIGSCRGTWLLPWREFLCKLPTLFCSSANIRILKSKY